MKLPTDERLKNVAKNPDPQFAVLYFQFGRYLLIGSSRPGSQVATLQGIWNDQMNPPWDSKMTVNINTEMNYWPAEVTNLSELHEPLFDMIEDVAKTGQNVAKEHYGARGWVLHHNTDLWRGTAPINRCRSRHLGDGRRVDVPPFVGALSVFRRQEIFTARLSDYEKRRAVFCGFFSERPKNRISGERPVQFARTRWPCDGANDGSSNHS